MRVIASALAVLGCSVSSVIRSPVDHQCQSQNLQSCTELVEGAVAYVEGDRELALRKLSIAKHHNSPQELGKLAAALREVASTTDAARPLADVASFLTEDASLPSAERAATLFAPEAAPVAAKPSTVVPPSRLAVVEDRQAIAARLALYALTAREDPARRVTETIELTDLPGTACQVAGGQATCFRRQKGPFVVTDVVTSEECGSRVFLAAADANVAVPVSGFAWLLPARAQGLHGGSFSLRGGQWLHVALKAAKPSPNDRGCFVTWSGFQPRDFQPRLVPSLANESEAGESNPSRFPD